MRQHLPRSLPVRTGIHTEIRPDGRLLRPSPAAVLRKGDLSSMWGVIDIGSNTIRLVIYALREGRLAPMINKKYAAGLAGYVTADRAISAGGIYKLTEILSEIKSMLRYIQVEEVFPFATASLRNSVNGREIVAHIRERFDFDVRILSGREEALFSYYGALNGRVGASGLVVDVGGGSAELAFFRDQKVLAATSLPVGSLNLYKRFVGEIVPTDREMKEIQREIKQQLRALPAPEGKPGAQPIYGVGGTARASLALINEKYQIPDSNAAYSCGQLCALLDELENEPHVFVDRVLRAAPERIHTIVPGLLIFKTIAKTFGTKSFVISAYGVREGYLLHVLKEKGVV